MQASNWAFVIAAYTVTWVLILGYWAYGHRALRRAQAEFQRVTGRRPGEGEVV